MKYKLGTDVDAYLTTYSFLTWQIAMAKVADKNGVIRLHHGFHSCRESICLEAAKALCADINNADMGAGEGLTKKDRRFTRLVLFLKVYRTYDLNGEVLKNKEREVKAAETSIKKAIFVINSLERNVGWPLTELYHLKTGLYNRKFHPADMFYYVKGSHKWFRAPSLLSLYCILLRAGCYAPVKSKRISSGDEKVFLNLQKEVRESGQPLKNYLTAGLYYGLLFLRKIDEVFEGRTIPFNYGTERLGSKDYSIAVEGFHRLMDGSTRDKNLHRTVKKCVTDEVDSEKEKEPQRMKAGG